MKRILEYIFGLEKDDKVIFFMKVTLLGNIFVAAVKLVSALILPSLWFFVNSCFMFVLCVARLCSVRDYSKIKAIKVGKEATAAGLKNYRNNGIILMFLGLVYFAISIYMLFRTSRISMHEYMTYLTALIAFWSVGSAIYGMAKYKRNSSPVIKAAKITDFCNALTSIVLTQVVLLNNFSADFAYLNVANGLTGMFVSAVIIGLGIYMIVGARRRIKAFEN